MKKTSLMIAGLTMLAGATFAAQATTTANTSVKTDNGQAKVSLRIQTKINFKKEIEAAKKYKAELISEVKAGKITKAEAKAKWSAKIEELKAKKKAYFEARFKRLEEKKAKLEKIAPEIAKKIENRLALIKEKREKIAKVRMKLRAEVKAGTISKKEFREKMKAEVKAVRKEEEAKRIAFLKEFKAERKALREEFKKRIAEKRALIKEAKSNFGIKFSEEKAKMRADLKAKIEADKKARMEVKAKLEAGEISLDEAKEKLKALREERKKIREIFVKEIKAKKLEIKDELKLGGFKADLKDELKAKKERREKIKEIKKEFKGIEKIMPMPQVKFDGKVKVKSKANSAVEGGEAEKTEFDTKVGGLHDAKMNIARNLKGIVEKENSNEKEKKESEKNKESYGVDGGRLKNKSQSVGHVGGFAVSGRVSNSVNNDVVCTMEFAPVCAKLNGEKKTYSNSCIAKKAHAEILYKGKCKENVKVEVKESGKVNNKEAHIKGFGGFGMPE